MNCTFTFPHFSKFLMGFQKASFSALVKIGCAPSDHEIFALALEIILAQEVKEFVKYFCKDLQFF